MTREFSCSTARSRCLTWQRDSNCALLYGVGHGMFPQRLAAILLPSLAVCAAAPSAQAWGCKGHEVVVLIAEMHLSDRAHRNAIDLLTAVPADPNLTHPCAELGDQLADASTWADDVRRVRRETGPWHFIDVPRGAPRSDLLKYCPPSSGCVTSALAEELRILRDPSQAPEARADALRFAVHFVGDIHQPLHASTNNDLGGNCVPVTFFGRTPAPAGPESTVFIPNLHEVWDVEILERFSGGKSPWDVAKQLDQKFSVLISSWQAQPTDFSAWAWESHELAEKIAYGRLPHKLPIETTHPMTACPAKGEVAVRDDENLAEDYQNAASPAVQEQLAKAGARLAAFLNSIWH